MHIDIQDGTHSSTQLLVDVTEPVDTSVGHGARRQPVNWTVNRLFGHGPDNCRHITVLICHLVARSSFSVFVHFNYQMIILMECAMLYKLILWYTQLFCDFT